MSVRKNLKCREEKALPNGHDKSWRDQFCWAMWERLQPEGAVGLSGYVLTKFSNMERNLAGVILKLSDKDKGVLLNHCPFCGASYEAWLKSHLKKKTA